MARRQHSTEQSTTDVVLQAVSLADSEATTFRVIDAGSHKILLPAQEQLDAVRDYAIELAEQRKCCLWQEYCDKRGRTIGHRVLLLDKRHT